MSNELQTKLDAIKLDKDTNLLPENLKKGVKVLGVNGTYNPPNKSNLWRTIYGLSSTDNFPVIAGSPNSTSDFSIDGYEDGDCIKLKRNNVNPQIVGIQTGRGITIKMNSEHAKNKTFKEFIRPYHSR